MHVIAALFFHPISPDDGVHRGLRQLCGPPEAEGSGHGSAPGRLPELQLHRSGRALTLRRAPDALSHAIRPCHAKLDAPIQRASLWGIVGGDGLLLSPPDGDEPLGSNPLLNQIVSYRIRPMLGKELIESFPALAIRVALDDEPDGRELVQDGRRLAE